MGFLLGMHVGHNTNSLPLAVIRRALD